MKDESVKRVKLEEEVREAVMADPFAPHVTCETERCMDAVTAPLMERSGVVSAMGRFVSSSVDAGWMEMEVRVKEPAETRKRW